MAFVSPRLLARNAAVTARRFPLSLICGAVAALAGIIMVGEETEDPWIRLMAVAGLGIPLFTFEAIATRERLRPVFLWLFRAFLAAILVLFHLASDGWTDESFGIRITQLAFAFHLVIMVGPGLFRSKIPTLWHHNKRIFLRFVLGVIYAGVLFGGLAGGLAALQSLFGVSIPYETYFWLFFLLAFVFHPWFVLAGIPKSLKELEDDEYPSVIRVFAQYVLVPLVCLYFLILTAYLVRVVILSDWPSGWIGNLISALAMAGILSIVLVHPERDRPGREWIAKYSRWFWIAILPQTGMLGAAIWQRIDQYGITEHRYMLVIGTLWLAGSALYVLARRPAGLRWISLSLGALALLTFIGPWSAYEVSRRGQSSRLESMLAGHGGFVEGRLTAVDAPIPSEDVDQFNDIFRYLIERHGTRAVDPWFDGGVRALIPEGSDLGERGRDAYELTRIVRNHLALSREFAPAEVVEDGPPTDFELRSKEQVVAAPFEWESEGAVGPDGEPMEGALAVLVDADLLGGRYSVVGLELSGENAREGSSDEEIRVDFETGSESSLAMRLGERRYVGSYEHTLKAARVPLVKGEDLIFLPREAMTVELMAEAEEGPQQNAEETPSGLWVMAFVTYMRFNEGELKKATGVVVMLQGPGSP